MSFGEKLKELREKNNLQQTDIARQLGLKAGNAVSNYENNVSKPHLDKFIQLCKIFKVDANYFLEEELSKIIYKQLPSDVQQLKNKYERLSDHEKEIVDYILNMKTPEIVKPEPTIIYRFPVYEQEAAAGAGITGRDGNFYMQNILADDIPADAVFGVYIKGESMENSELREDVPNHSIVLLNPRVDGSDLNKSIIVASINNEIICKQFLIEQNYIHFYSLNRAYEHEDRFAYSLDEYKIIGKVVKVIKENEYE